MAAREAERDMWEQRNTQFQTLVLAATVMIGGGFSLIVEGTLPEGSGVSGHRVPDFVVVCYSFFLACGFVLLFLSIVISLKVLSKISKFMYNQFDQQYKKMKFRLDGYSRSAKELEKKLGIAKYEIESKFQEACEKHKYYSNRGSNSYGSKNGTTKYRSYYTSFAECYLPRRFRDPIFNFQQNNTTNFLKKKEISVSNTSSDNNIIKHNENEDGDPGYKSSSGWFGSYGKKSELEREARNQLKKGKLIDESSRAGPEVSGPAASVEEELEAGEAYETLEIKYHPEVQQYEKRRNNNGSNSASSSTSYAYNSNNNNNTHLNFEEESTEIVIPKTSRKGSIRGSYGYISSKSNQHHPEIYQQNDKDFDDGIASSNFYNDSPRKYSRSSKLPLSTLYSLYKPNESVEWLEIGIDNTSTKIGGTYREGSNNINGSKGEWRPGRILRRDRDGSYLVKIEEDTEGGQNKKMRGKNHGEKKKIVRIHDPQMIVKVDGYERGEAIEFRESHEDGDIWKEGIILSYDKSDGTYIIQQNIKDNEYNSDERNRYSYSLRNPKFPLHGRRKKSNEKEIIQNVDPRNIRPQPYQRSSELQHHWEEECKKDASLAKRFFYFGTVSLMIAICILAGARFWLVYDSFIGTFIFAAICMAGLLVSLQYFAWGKNKKNIKDEEMNLN